MEYQLIFYRMNQLNDPKHEKFFGREHLPRISWLLSGRKGAAPSIAYNLPSQVDKEVLAKSATDQLPENQVAI